VNGHQLTVPVVFDYERTSRAMASEASRIFSSATLPPAFVARRPPRSGSGAVLLVLDFNTATPPGYFYLPLDYPLGDRAAQVRACAAGRNTPARHDHDR